MRLFETERDLEGFLFRITDNGGESADRFTIMFCDGDYFASSLCPTHPQGVGIWGERFDPQIAADNVEAGTERDLRWIDLPENIRQCLLNSLNQVFEDWLSTAELGVSDSRIETTPNEGGTNSVGIGIYRTTDGFMIRREGSADDDLGPYTTFREAVLNTLPMDCDLSGPEYHTTVDLWEKGEPRPLWDREIDPPTIDENLELARVSIVDTTENVILAWFATSEDAQNYLNHSTAIDPDKLYQGHYHIDSPEGY